jgi:hypothetical protein
MTHADVPERSRSRRSNWWPRPDERGLEHLSDSKRDLENALGDDD